MASGFDVFKSAMALMDEMDSNDYSEYCERSVNILNGLIQECYPYSDTYVRPTDSKRSTPEMMTETDLALLASAKFFRTHIVFLLGYLERQMRSVV